MGVRVKEDGESERRAVMVRIRVAPSGNITRRESGQTSIWSFVTREFGEPTQETLQMTAGSPAGAVSHPPMNRPAINWLKVRREVRRLQARIVKVTQPRSRDGATASCKGRLKGLSPVTGNRPAGI